jgi:hypothetical protein
MRQKEFQCARYNFLNICCEVNYCFCSVQICGPCTTLAFCTIYNTYFAVTISVSNVKKTKLEDEEHVSKKWEEMYCFSIVCNKTVSFLVQWRQFQNNKIYATVTKLYKNLVFSKES